MPLGIKLALKRGLNVVYVDLPPLFVAGVEVISARYQTIIVINDYCAGFRALRGFRVFFGKAGAGCETDIVSGTDFFSTTSTTLVS